MLVRLWRKWKSCPVLVGKHYSQPPRKMGMGIFKKKFLKCDLVILLWILTWKIWTHCIRYHHHYELFLITKIWNQSKCRSSDQWVNKRLYICVRVYMLNYYSTVKWIKLYYLNQMIVIGKPLVVEISDTENQILQFSLICES